MSVNSELDKIEDIKVSIYNAIKDKNVDIPADTPFEDYPLKVSSITGGGSGLSYILKVNSIPSDASLVYRSGNAVLSQFNKQCASIDGSTVNYQLTKEGYDDYIGSITLSNHTELTAIMTAKNYRIFVGQKALFVITPEMDLYGSGIAHPNATGATSVQPSFGFIAHNVVEVFISQTTCGYLNTSNELYIKGNSDSTRPFVTAYTKEAENVRTLGHNISGMTNVIAYIDLNNNLWMRGQNSFGEQGSGNTSAVRDFTKRAENVKDYYFYYWASFYTTNTNDLYICGGQYQQGSGSSYGVYTFTKRAENVKTVCPSNGYGSFYISTNDELYGTGQRIYPSGKGQSYSFQKWADNVKEARFVGTTSALLHYITKDNKLYGSATGNSTYGWLGNGIRTDTQLDVLLSNDCITSCMVNTGNAAYVDSNGDIYVTGYGGKYTLTQTTYNFTKVESEVDLMYNIDSAENNLLYLKNSYYGLGTNTCGKLGIDNSQAELTVFTQLDFGV